MSKTRTRDANGDVIKDLPAIATGIFSDMLTSATIPGSGALAASAAAAIRRVVARRREGAKQILLEELRQGKRLIEGAEDFDETVAMTIRYCRAADEGAARLNLRLMAKIISGDNSPSKRIEVDEFLHYSEVLQSLTYEEVVTIATLHKHYMSIEGKGKQGSSRHDWATTKTKEELMGIIFSSKYEFDAVISGVSRTGFISVDAAFGGLVYGTSEKLEKLLGVVDIEDAINKEKSE